jgi:hypothetical protein
VGQAVRGGSGGTASLSGGGLMGAVAAEPGVKVRVLVSRGGGNGGGLQ